jgi:FkbM family methyltransferase
MYFLRLAGQKLNLTGAKEIASSDEDMAKLKLNRNYPLGIKGTEIQLPKDKIIFQFIRLRGGWELKESRFLANELKRLSTSEKSEKIALIDIGANVGIVTLQAMNLAKTSNACIFFEPSSLNASSLKKNLSNSHFKFTVNEFALSNFDGEATLYTEGSNRGNSSLIEALVPISEKSSEKVKIRDTREFFNFELTSFNIFIIKCDTQGYDALILSRIPPIAWNKVNAAVIEVWALPSIKELDVKILLSKLSEFSSVSWDSDFNSNLDLDNLAKFWLSKTSESRNLFIRK